MRILCLGTSQAITDRQASDLARARNMQNLGILSDLDGPLDLQARTTQPGVYHTSFVDLCFSRVKEASGYFDVIYVLDQPLSAWKTMTEFYQTIDLALRLDHNVEWQNPAVRQNFLYWQDKLARNKSLCVWPFVQMNLSDFDARLCCVSTKSLPDTIGVQDFNNETYVDIRKKMLDGEQLDHCESCYRSETNGITSARIHQTLEWVSRLNLATTQELSDIRSPLSFEITVDNLCNLQCRMCAPISSSLIEKEYRKLGIIQNQKISVRAPPRQHLDDLLHVERIEKLYFTGGEPTINRRVQDFLAKCVQQHRTDFLLQINTNAVKISQRFVDLIKNFDRVEFFVSIDAFGKANDYVRWRSQWATIHKNIEKIKDLGVVSFTVTVSLYGIFSFSDLLHFLDQRYPGHYVHCQYAENQSPFLIDYDPAQIRKIMAVRQLSIYNDNPSLRSWIDGLIESMRKSKLQAQKLRDFFNHNDLLDASRDSRLYDYIPELEQQRAKI